MAAPSLRLRLFAAYALVVLAALASATALETRAQRHWLLEHNRVTLTRAAREVARFLVNDPTARAGRWTPATGEADSATGYRITLIARDGTVVADSRADAAALENHADRPEVRAALAGIAGSDVRHSRSLGVDLQYVAVPADAPAPYAVVRVALTTGRDRDPGRRGDCLHQSQSRGRVEDRRADMRLGTQDDAVFLSHGGQRTERVNGFLK